MRNERADRQRASVPAQPGDAETAWPGIASAARFFLAVHRGALGASRIYRVYPDADGLSFVGLGPLHPWIDLESARKLDSTHWAVRASQVIRKGVAITIAGCTAVAGVLSRILLHAAFRDAPAVLDLILFVLTAAGIFVPLLLLVVTGSIRIFTGRVSYVDSLTDEQIRMEAEGAGWFSFRVAADEARDVSIDPVEAKGAKGKTAILLSFAHEPTGKWKLELLTRKDARIAARTFVQLLGQENVAVNVHLKKD